MQQALDVTIAGVQVEHIAATDQADEGEEEDAKKHKPREAPLLARTVGRVTVILPSKN